MRWGPIHEFVEIERGVEFPFLGIHFIGEFEWIGLFKRILFLIVNLHQNINSTLVYYYLYSHERILESLLSQQPRHSSLPHQPPLLQEKVLLLSSSLDQCLQSVNNLRCKNTPAIFVSINGITENPEDCQLLHDAFKYTADRERLDF